MHRWLNEHGQTFIYPPPYSLLLYICIMILGIVTYLILALVLAFWGRERNVGFVSALLFSVLLTPIAGLIVVINSPKLILYHIVQHHCPQCGYSFDEAHESCPICQKDGKFVLLNPTIVPTT